MLPETMLHTKPYYDPSSPSNTVLDWTTTQPQTQSLLGKLPAEVRLKIWSAVWQATGPVQHIIRSGLYHWNKPYCDVRFYHVACVTDLDNPDTSREGHLQNLDYKVAEKRARTDPTFSDGTDPCWKEDCYYCIDYYDCFFSQSEMPAPPIEKSAFMGMLLLCKSFHSEIVESMYDSITWVMILGTAETFLSELRLPFNTHMRSMILQLDVSGPSESDHASWDKILEATHNMPQLRQIELWLDSNRRWRNNIERTTIERPRLVSFVAKLREDVELKISLPKSLWDVMESHDEYDVEIRRVFMWWITRGGGVEGPWKETLERMTPLDLKNMGGKR